jgi:hypothetical protein
MVKLARCFWLCQSNLPRGGDSAMAAAKKGAKKAAKKAAKKPATKGKK